MSQVPGSGVRVRRSVVGDGVGGSGRLELGHLLLDLVVCVIVWSREDERDRLGREVAAADEPFVSLKDVGMSSGVAGRLAASCGSLVSGC